MAFIFFMALLQPTCMEDVNTGVLEKINNI